MRFMRGCGQEYQANVLGNWREIFPIVQNLCFGSGSHLALGAFVKLRKVCTSFVMSVCPSVRMEQLGSH